MKKAIAFLMIIGFSIFGAAPAFCASTSTPAINVLANVPSGITLTLVMKKNSWQGAVITAMDFGDLIDIGTGTLRSSPNSTTGTGSADCFLSANTHGAAYNITQTGTALKAGTNEIPSGACTVVPVYAAEDNGNLTQPAGSVLGSAGTWVGTRTIYTSETTANARAVTVQAFYSVTDDPAAGATTGVPMSQPSGNYSAQVTFTLATV